MGFLMPSKVSTPTAMLTGMPLQPKALAKPVEVLTRPMQYLAPKSPAAAMENVITDPLGTTKKIL